MNKVFTDLLNQADDLSGPMREVYEAGMALEKRVEELEEKVRSLELALKNSQPALQAASRFIPIGENGPYTIRKQGPLK